MRWAGLVALPAVDARLSVAADFCRAENGNNSHQRAVWAEKAAPEILDEHRQRDQRCHHHDSENANGTEKVQHFNVCHNAKRGCQKITKILRRHLKNNEEKEREQNVLQTAQRKIEPQRQVETAPSQLAAQLPKIF
jgi:PleD family two-component response regulator